MENKSKTAQAVKKFIDRYGQRLVNIYLFVTFTAWCSWQTYGTYREGRLDFVEISFALQNVILVSLFLIRREHKAINMRILDQTVAVIAFFSGAAFIGQPLTGTGTAMAISRGVIIMSNILGTLTLLNLGRSFGILIACREVKTHGLYSVVRHPMYFTDILLRVGYLISHCTPFTITAFVLSTACYIYRSVLEERFLSQQPEYAAYMQRVKYRFIPYVF